MPGNAQGHDDHDHHHADDGALGANERAVLAEIEAADRPLTAYDILDRLRPGRPKVAPTTVYRALARLTDADRVHRIETLNAYVACPSAGAHRHGETILAICDDCGTVDEHIAPGAMAAISDTLGQSGFRAARPIVEVRGRCAGCDTRAAEART